MFPLCPHSPQHHIGLNDGFSYYCRAIEYNGIPNSQKGDSPCPLKFESNDCRTQRVLTYPWYFLPPPSPSQRISFAKYCPPFSSPIFIFAKKTISLSPYISLLSSSSPSQNIFLTPNMFLQFFLRSSFRLKKKVHHWI